MHRLFITCDACGSAYSVQRFEPTALAQPTYCAYCGSERTKLNQNADALANEVLAERYSLAPSQFVLLVKAFGQQREHTHFTDYLRALVAQSEERKVNAAESE